MWREWVERGALIAVIVSSPFAAYGVMGSEVMSVRSFYVTRIACVIYAIAIVALVLLMWS